MKTTNKNLIWSGIIIFVVLSSTLISLGFNYVGFHTIRADIGAQYESAPHMILTCVPNRAAGLPIIGPLDCTIEFDKAYSMPADSLILDLTDSISKEEKRGWITYPEYECRNYHCINLKIAQTSLGYNEYIIGIRSIQYSDGLLQFNLFSIEQAYLIFIQEISLLILGLGIIINSLVTLNKKP